MGGSEVLVCKSVADNSLQRLVAESQATKLTGWGPSSFNVLFSFPAWNIALLEGQPGFMGVGPMALPSLCLRHVKLDISTVNFSMVSAQFYLSISVTSMPS